MRNSMPERKGETAERLFSRGQLVALGLLALLAITVGVFYGVTGLLRVVASLVTAFYLLFAGLKLAIFAAGVRSRFAQPGLPSLTSLTLPAYTLLIPMHREKEAGFVKLQEALARLQYPIEKLQIILILEEKDVATRGMVDSIQLPGHYQVIVVPDCGPTTKPKACNYAMKYVRGDRLVIFDFEDRPEPDHLLKAVAGLDRAHAKDARVACVQGMLQFWNPRSGVASPFYWGEYIVHFRWMLAGMTRLRLIPPLGGTSNHFFVDALNRVAEHYDELVFVHKGVEVRMLNVWDAYNVTEDADLAARLARLGFRIEMIDAVTFEEAPNSLKKAKGQRSRWIKGYLQTALVQSRRPLTSIREIGFWRYCAYLLFVGGTPVSLLINPVVWSTTLLYVMSRLLNWQEVTLFIEGLFPAPVYYTAMAVAIIGNATLLYQKLVTPLKQQEHDSFIQLTPGMQAQQFGLVKWLVLTPLWWIFTTVPTYVALFELMRPGKRFYWNKTEHGHNVGHEAQVLEPAPARPALGSGSSVISSNPAQQTAPIQRME